METILLVFFLLASIIMGLMKKDKIKKLTSELKEAVDKADKNAKKADYLKSERDDLFKRYSPIIDMESHARKIRSEADDFLTKAKSEKQEASKNIREAKEKAEAIELSARDESVRIKMRAEQDAKEIAGDAYEAKSKADTYKSAIKAMKNTIDGYKDDYIVPNHSVLDELAEEFGHKEAGENLKQARSRVRSMVRDGFAGACDYAETHRKTYAIHFAVDAFNGKVDSAIAKVKYDNYGKIKQEIVDAFALVNHNGEPFKNARISQEYLEARLIELKWAVATLELKKIEREEQAEIKAQIKEEERAIKEMEKAQKAAIKEERSAQEALEKARAEMASANKEQRSDYEARILDLEEKLKEASEKGQRALSMAQQTRRGHVYVISNIGSFGAGVFKIGMTRRLEPLDRVKELGDASVPFSFDVHAMIYSEDAPSLEKELHRRFESYAVNKVNPRKEFFKTSISEVKEAVEKHGIQNVRWTLKAEASEYHESNTPKKQRSEDMIA